MHQYNNIYTNLHKYLNKKKTKPKALYINKKEKTKKPKSQNKPKKKKPLPLQCLHSANTLIAQYRSTVRAYALLLKRNIKEKEKTNGRPQKKICNYGNYSASWYCSYYLKLKKLAHKNCTVYEHYNMLCEQWPNTVTM